MPESNDADAEWLRKLADSPKISLHPNDCEKLRATANRLDASPIPVSERLPTLTKSELSQLAHDLAKWSKMDKPPLFRLGAWAELIRERIGEL